MGDERVGFLLAEAQGFVARMLSTRRMSLAAWARLMTLRSSSICSKVSKPRATQSLSLRSLRRASPMS